MFRKIFVGVVGLGLGAAAVAAPPPGAGHPPATGRGTATPAKAVPVEMLRQVDKFTYPAPTTAGKTLIKVIIRLKTPEKSSKLGDMQGKLQQSVPKSPR